MGPAVARHPARAPRPAFVRRPGSLFPFSSLRPPLSSLLRPAPSKGITLIEMLVVIGILATLMAISAGAWIISSRRYREQGAAAQVETTIRQARNDALFSGAPAFVEFDTKRPGKAPRLIPWGYRIAGMWHFEESGRETTGGLGNRAFVNNCKSAEGKVGRAVATGWVRAGQPVRGFVESLPNPDFDCEDGGLLEAYILIEYNDGRAQYVIHKPECYALFVHANGYLCGRVGRATAEAPDFLIPMRRWTKVAMAFDKNSIRLMVEDAIIAVAPGDTTPIRSNPLYIGDPGEPILGRIDEVKLLTAVRGNPFDLPYGAKLVHNTAPWNAAFFTANGQLDLRYHPGSLTIDMILDGKRHPIYVSMLGATRRGEIERAKTQDELDQEEAAQNAAITAQPRTLAPITTPPIAIPRLPPKPPKPPATDPSPEKSVEKTPGPTPDGGTP